MALVLGDLYRALREAGAGHDTAMAAAHEALVATRNGGASTLVDRPVRILGLPRDAAGHLLIYMSGIATGLSAALVLLR